MADANPVVFFDLALGGKFVIRPFLVLDFMFDPAIDHEHHVGIAFLVNVMFHFKTSMIEPFENSRVPSELFLSWLASSQPPVTLVTPERFHSI